MEGIDLNLNMERPWKAGSAWPEEGHPHTFGWDEENDQAWQEKQGVSE
jgi:hypothetical protein